MSFFLTISSLFCIVSYLYLIIILPENETESFTINTTQPTTTFSLR